MSRVLYLSNDMILVQIGCHHGNDHVFKFISQHYDKIEKAVLVDANINALEKAKTLYKQYDKVSFIHTAVSDKKETREFFIPKRCPDHASLSTQQMQKMGHKDVDTVVIECLTVSDILQQHDIQHVDYFCIDTEGYDYHIVKTLDQNISLGILRFERRHMTGVQFEELKKSLEELDFTFVRSDHLDVIFKHNQNSVQDAILI